MKQINEQIGFIGAGNMAEAMIGAVLRAGLMTPAHILVSDPSETRTNRIKTDWGVRAAQSNAQLVAASDTVILAVKPQVMDAVLAELAAAGAFAPRENRRRFLSIAAGIPIARLEAVIYEQRTESEKKRMPILRVMPNTPALVGAGMSGLCANAFAQPDDMDAVRPLLEAMGKVKVVDETAMDAVTALSGSGPAYAFYLLEAMIEAGQRLGLETEDAAELSQRAISGALALIEAQKQGPDVLRRKVTSPGGTTEAAIGVLDRSRVKQAIVSAVLAAAERSGQLSQSKTD